MPHAGMAASKPCSEQGLKEVWKDTLPAWDAGGNLTHETGPGMPTRHLPAAVTLPLESLHPQARYGSQEMCGSWTEHGCLVRWESRAACRSPTRCGA